MIKKILKKLFYKVGLEPINSSKNLDKNLLLNNFYNVLLELNFDVNHIIDVGANHGTWTRQTLKFFPKANYTLLEPQENLRKSFEDLLKNPKVKYFPLGAGAENGNFTFTIVDRDDSCSFRYTEEEALGLGYEQKIVPVITLNDLVLNNDLITPDLIKIDAEGNDLEVLEGCSNFFGITEVFMIEAAVVNKIFNNSVHKVINYMNSKGYNLFDITDLNRPLKVKALWLVELVFVKAGGKIDSDRKLTFNEVE